MLGQPDQSAGVDLSAPTLEAAGHLGRGDLTPQRFLPLTVWRQPRAVLAGEILAGWAPADGATSRMLGLWIDLIRQAGARATAMAPPNGGGLSRHQLNALDCLGSGRHTAGTLARALGVSTAFALALVGRLVGEGAVVVVSDTEDGGLPLLAATAEGTDIAEEDRRVQSGVLSRLLDQLTPARLVVMRRAMADLARAAGQPTQFAPPPTSAAPSPLELSWTDRSSPPGGRRGRRGSGPHLSEGYPDPLRRRQSPQVDWAIVGAAFGPQGGAGSPSSTGRLRRSRAVPAGRCLRSSLAAGQPRAGELRITARSLPLQAEQEMS